MSQLTILDDYNNISSFTPISETSIPKGFVSEGLLLELTKRGYFKENSDVWIDRIRNCGFSGINLQAWYDCGDIVGIEPGCNSRICKRCNLRYARKEVKKMGFVIAHMSTIKHLVISPKNYTRDEFNSGFAIKDLNNIWQQLRKSLINDSGFKINSFVAVREFVGNMKGGPVLDKNTGSVLGFYDHDNWNIHLHVVYDGDYIPQKLISSTMMRVTKGRSRYAYIKSEDSRVGYGHIKTTKYLSKYIGKFHIPSNDLGLEVDFYMNTKNKKLVTYSHDIDKVDFRRYKLTCPVCYKGFLSQVVGTAKDRVTGETYFYEIKINVPEILQKEKEKHIEKITENQEQSHYLMQKIDKLLQQRHNALSIETLLTPKELDYLLKLGFIGTEGTDTYVAWC